MGPNGVAIVLAVEVRFGIVIDDADATNLTAPRRLADYVFERLCGRPWGGAFRRNYIENYSADLGGRCLSPAGFYRLRAILVSRFGARRSEALPELPLQGFLRGDVRKQWAELRQAIGAPGLPNLERSPRISAIAQWSASPAGAAYAFLYGMPTPAVAGTALGAWFAALLTLNLAGTQVPKEVCTVAALTSYVRVAPVRQAEAWCRETVLRRVLQIVSTETGFPINVLQPDHRFVEDLGVD